jgi:hypothetical protein
MPTDDMKRAAHKAVVSRVLEGAGRAPRAQRRAAYENTGLVGPLGTLIEKVAKQPTRITDEDFAAMKASGLSEDQAFELVICAAIGQATRQYEIALAALAEATTGRDTQNTQDMRDAVADETADETAEEGSEHAARDPQ